MTVWEYYKILFGVFFLGIMAEAEENSEVAKAETFSSKFERLSGFQLKDLTSWDRFVKLMFRPTDPASLGITRVLFGKFFSLKDFRTEIFRKI